jgi:hypothetical protein
LRAWNTRHGRESMMSEETLQYCIDREKEYIQRIAELESQLGNARAELQNYKDRVLHLESVGRIRTAKIDTERQRQDWYEHGH